jgi:alpha-galactosidase
VGPLPDHLAVLVNISAQCEELAVQGCVEGDARKIFYACAYDPLTSAVLSLQEIKDMVQEMFYINKPFLSQFKTIAL